jgi:hypothetical protein
VTVRVVDRLRNRIGLSIQKKNGLPIGAVQFNQHIVPNWSRERVKQAAIGRNRKWNFLYRLKSIGQFDECRRIKAIYIKCGWKGWSWRLRSTGKEGRKKEEGKGDSEPSKHKRYYTGGVIIQS